LLKDAIILQEKDRETPMGFNIKVFTIPERTRSARRNNRCHLKNFKAIKLFCEMADIPISEEKPS
jgi:hypothetical protein